jgi:hypothetical protein
MNKASVQSKKKVTCSQILCAKLGNFRYRACNKYISWISPYARLITSSFETIEEVKYIYTLLQKNSHNTNIYFLDMQLGENNL